MALTIGNRAETIHGNQRVVRGTIAFDASYPDGGEALTAGNLGMNYIDLLLCSPTKGYSFEYDYAGAKLLAYGGRSQVLSIQSTVVGNVGTGEDDLMSFTLKANTLDANNRGVRVTAWGKGANNANAKTLKGKLGATVLVTTSLTASQVDTWRTVIDIIRTGAATQEVLAQLLQAGTTTIIDIEQSEPAEDLTTDLAIKFTGEATADNDITQEGMLVELIATPGTGTAFGEVTDTQDLSGLSGVRFVAWGG